VCAQNFVRIDLVRRSRVSPRTADSKLIAGGPDWFGSAEATGAAAIELFLLLALVMSLCRMLVSYFGFLSGLSGLLLGAHMVAAAVLLRRSPMSFRSLVVLFGSLLVHILRHCGSLLFEGRSSVTSGALESSNVSVL
jgi:hypothetical protein